MEGVEDEVIMEVVLHVFRKTGSMRMVGMMSQTCKRWQNMIMRDDKMMELLAGIRGWALAPTVGVIIAWKEVIQRHCQPFLDRDKILYMTDRPMSKLYVDGSTDSLFGYFDGHGGIIIKLLQRGGPMLGWNSEGKSLLWMGSTSPFSLFLLCVFSEEKGVHVLEKATMRHVKVILEKRCCKWCTPPLQLGDDYYMYKTEGQTLKRGLVSDSRLLSDDGPQGGEWETVCDSLADGSVMCMTPTLMMTAHHNDDHQGLCYYYPDGLIWQKHPSYYDYDEKGVCVGLALDGYPRVIDGKTLKETRMPGFNDSMMCSCICAKGMMVAMLMRLRAAAATFNFYNDDDEGEEQQQPAPHEWKIMIRDLMSGWTQTVHTRQDVTDLQWTDDGNLVALSGKAVFVVGGRQSI